MSALEESVTTPARWQRPSTCQPAPRSSLVPKKCPTPTKQAHATADAAHAHARSLRKNKPTIDERPYECVCGNWHVGARKRRKPRRVR